MSRIDVRVIVKAKIDERQADLMRDLYDCERVQRSYFRVLKSHVAVLDSLERSGFVIIVEGPNVARLTPEGWIIAKELNRLYRLSELEKLAELGRQRR